MPYLPARSARSVAALSTALAASRSLVQHSLILSIVAASVLLSLQGIDSARAQELRPDPIVAGGTEPAAPSPSAVQSLADRALNSAQEMAMQAMGMIGIRYTFGGRSPDTGFDCSGLVRYVFDRVTGRSLPHNSYEMARMGTSVGQGELEPGDLVFFNTRGRRFSHVGIYVGDGRFIHAPSRGGRVHIVNMGERYWVSRFNGARRLAG
ncbi:MAG: C40 family peptidase [Rhodocyclaceae bacterium]|nr:C40 family peptidase [Rhodocyclaceae bacterium]MCA4903018.1 C40 family peptidase [Rhodocyclaceae bacterium]